MLPTSTHSGCQAKYFVPDLERINTLAELSNSSGELDAQDRGRARRQRVLSLALTSTTSTVSESENIIAHNGKVFGQWQGFWRTGLLVR